MKDPLEQRLEELKDIKLYIVDNEFTIFLLRDKKYHVMLNSINKKSYDIKSFKTLNGAKKFINKLKDNE